MRFGIWIVAGILEKSKRLRKALFFIVKNLPISCAAEGHAQTAECGARYFVENRAAVPNLVKSQPRGGPEKPGNCQLKCKYNRETRQGACRDSRSRRRQPRRFANSDLNSFAPVLRPVSAPPARGAACLKLPSRDSLAL